MWRLASIKPLYYFDIHYLNIDSYVGMPIETIQKNYDILIHYQSLFYQGSLILPDFPMSSTGVIHFEEVKRIFECLQVLCIITGIPSGILLYQCLHEKEYRALKYTSIFTIIIPTVIGLLASIDFDQAFVIFHKIFFRNDYWIFDRFRDPVINILPQDFFMHCFMMAIILILCMSGICYGYYRYQEKRILKTSHVDKNLVE